MHPFQEFLLADAHRDRGRAAHVVNSKLEVIVGIRDRPEMWGLDRKVESCVAFLMGLDAGYDGLLLAGFNEWLTVKLDAGENLGWPSHIRTMAFPDTPSLWPLTSDLSNDENETLRALLFVLLVEFLGVRSTAGLRSVFEEFFHWRQAQPWCRS